MGKQIRLHEKERPRTSGSVQHVKQESLLENSGHFKQSNYVVYSSKNQ